MKRIIPIIIAVCLAAPASSLAATKPPPKNQKALTAALHKKHRPAPKKVVAAQIVRWDQASAELPFMQTCVDAGHSINNCLCLLAGAEVKSPDPVALNTFRIKHPVAFQQWHILVVLRCASVK